MNRPSNSDILIMAIGSIIAVTSAYGIYTEYEAQVWYYVVPFAIFFTAAVITVADPHRSAVRSAGIYACACSLSFLIDGYAGIIETRMFTDILSLIIFSLGLLQLGLGLVMFPAGVTYLRGRSGSAFLMVMPILIMLCIEILAFIMIFRHGYSMEEAQAILGWPIPDMVCSAAILLLMSRSDIRKNTLGWKLGNGIAEAKVALYTEPSAHIMPEDLETVRGWLSDGEADELHIALHLPRKRMCQLIFYRFDGRAYMTLAEADSDSYMSSFRMALDSIVPDGRDGRDAVRFYSRDGSFSRILVGDPGMIV